MHQNCSWGNKDDAEYEDAYLDYSDDWVDSDDDNYGGDDDDGEDCDHGEDDDWWSSSHFEGWCLPNCNQSLTRIQQFSLLSISGQYFNF